MTQMNRSDHDILIYLWNSKHSTSVPVGTLSLQAADNDDYWTFKYHSDFLKMPVSRFFDPLFKLIKNPTESFSSNSHFSIFMDSMPDSWGQNLHRLAVKMKKTNVDNKQHKILYQTSYVDYYHQVVKESPISTLLMVTDPLRKGGLRFKTLESGPFLEQDTIKAVPGIDYLDVIEAGMNILERDEESAETEQTLKTLFSPSASLGGSRPKCSVRDQKDQLWIAKCPSLYDQVDKGAWEYLCWLMAKQTGIEVPDAGLQKGIRDHHIFLSKRFDRNDQDRIHFISANTAIRMIAQSDHLHLPGYLHLAEFIQFHGSEPKKDLHQLWRRLFFNLAISNHDDHLNNHGFLLTEKGWKLAPAFDLNPATLPSKGRRTLSIEHGSGKRDPESAFEIGKFMQLSEKEMKQISEEVYDSISSWKKKAVQLEIKTVEIEALSRSFILPAKFRPITEKPKEIANQPVKRSFFRDLKTNKNIGNDESVNDQN